MIRFILCIIVLFLFLSYSIFDVIFGFILKIINKRMLISYRCSVVRFVFKIIIFISGIHIDVEGINNIDEATKEKSVVIIGNHRGIFDVIIGYSMLKFPCGLVAKDSLEKIPFLSYWMRNIGCLFLKRDDLRSGVMMVINAVKNLNDGLSMWIFPEGTRNKNKEPLELLDFKAGAFKIPEKAGVKVLPFGFVNTEDIYENHKPFLKPVNVKVRIGKMYSMNELGINDATEFSEYSKKIIKDLLIEQ